VFLSLFQSINRSRNLAISTSLLGSDNHLTNASNILCAVYKGASVIVHRCLKTEVSLNHRDLVDIVNVSRPCTSVCSNFDRITTLSIYLLHIVCMFGTDLTFQIIKVMFCSWKAAVAPVHWLLLGHVVPQLIAAIGHAQALRL